MDFTVTVADKANVLPFEIFKQDKDEVIMLINYYILKADADAQVKPNVKPAKNDGFWDF